MNEPFGAPVGKIDDLASIGLKNGFASIPTRDIEDMVQSDRIQPRQVGTGVMRGTQRIVNTDGSYITLGEIPDSSGGFGVAFFTADGVLVSVYKADSQRFYDSAGNIVSEQTADYQAFYAASGSIVSKQTADYQAFYAANGSVISKQTAETQYIYDKTTGKNVMQVGRLPDGTYGWAVAASGYNVADGIS